MYENPAYRIGPLPSCWKSASWTRLGYANLLTVEYLLALELTTVCNDGEVFDICGFARLCGHSRELITIDSFGHDLVRNDY
jgi:hypothetical protein